MKTGKTNTSGSYSQEDGKYIHFAEWDSSVDSKPKMGHIRYNTEIKLIEVMTRRGWQPILTQDQINDDPDKKLTDGIGATMQTAKKMGMISLYFQGRGDGIINYKNEPGPSSPPDWLNVVNSGNSTYIKQLVNEGRHAYLFEQNPPGTHGIRGLVAHIDIPKYLGISESDKYKWTYTATAGIAGYGLVTPLCGQSPGFHFHKHEIAKAKLRTGITCLPSWAPPSPDETNNNDTSTHYGRFTTNIVFVWSHNSRYNANFNILINAKKFKGFDS